MKIASINIDVDPLVSYYAIHGLKSETISEDPIYAYGIKRFLDLLDDYSIKGAFFITASGFNQKNQPILNEIVGRGHEIADHSFSHDYRLTLMAKEKIFDEIESNRIFIEKITGFRCKGFRSPGYNSSPDLISVLKSNGYIYDSSLFPSPSYYLAKWLLIKIKKFAGHISKSFIYSFKDAFGYYKPKFIDKNVRDVRDSGDFVELPMTTLLPFLGIPLIGTSIVVFPKFLLDFLLSVSKRRSFINIEAHGIDLCDAEESALFKPLIKIQPDLRRPLDRKIKRFRHVIDFYLKNGFVFKSLSEVAEMKLNSGK